MALLSSRNRKSNVTASGSDQEEWPELPALKNTRTIYVDSERWMQHPCPPELEKLPIRLPAVVAGIVKASTRSDQYDDTSLFMNMDPSKTGLCSCCYSERPARELVHLGCQHKYCRHCIERMAQVATQSEYLFPPSCCSQEIPQDKVLNCLSSGDGQRYRTKAREYSTPHADRWYCPSPTCSKWVPAELMNRRSGAQVCPYCRTSICSRCRSRSHSGDCVSDDAVLREARFRKWQRCYRCAAIIELLHGCNHIKCRCGAEFCYSCGKEWTRNKPCSCGSVELALLEEQDEGRGLNIDLVVAGLHYAEDDSAYEATRETHSIPDLMRLQEEEETWYQSGDPHQMISVEDHLRIMREYLSEINRLQQLNMARRQRAQTLSFLYPQGQTEGKRSLFGKLWKNFETCIRRLVSMPTREVPGYDDVLQSTEQEREQESAAKSVLRSLVQEFAYDRIWFDEATAEREVLLERYRLELINNGKSMEPLCLVPAGV